jgi:hypothetical protein
MSSTARVSSAAAWGREGVGSLSDESIALFNQSEAPIHGPAGRPIAFDVLPGGAIDLERVRAELARERGEGLRLSLGALQVPTFTGEGNALVPFGMLALALVLFAYFSPGRGSNGGDVAAESPSVTNPADTAPADVVPLASGATAR